MGSTFQSQALAFFDADGTVVGVRADGHNGYGLNCQRGDGSDASGVVLGRTDVLALFVASDAVETNDTAVDLFNVVRQWSAINASPSRARRRNTGGDSTLEQRASSLYDRLFRLWVQFNRWRFPTYEFSNFTLRYSIIFSNTVRERMYSIYRIKRKRKLTFYFHNG